MARGGGRSQNGAARPARFERFPGGLVVVMLLILCTLVLVGAGGAMLLQVGPAHAARHAADGPRKAMGALAALPAMEFTLADDRRVHTVNLKVTLEFAPGTDAEALQQAIPRVAMAVSGRMIEAQPADLSGGSGTAFVKQQVSIAANRELAPLKVRSVMLQHFLVR